MSDTAPNGPARSDETLSFLGSRRSVPAKAMTAPGPDAAQIDEILTIAARVPDHRALVPFRFVVFEGAGKAAFADVLSEAKTAPAGKREKAAKLYEKAPVVIAVISSPDREDKTPVWEQELTVGATCQNLLIAAAAQGWGAQWLTGWPAYDETVAKALSLKKHERVAAFTFIGTPKAMPGDRKRPKLDDIVTRYGD